jgi:hypothetical protein
MPYTQGHVPVQCIQPDAAGFYDPNQQQPCVPQQMQHLQQRTSFYNQIPQVRPLTPYSVHSNYVHPIAHHQYVTSFPALTDKMESPIAESRVRKTSKRQPRNPHAKR